MIVKQNSPYIPIDCSFHDVLLAKATLKEVCQIVYVLDQKEVTTNAMITDVFTRKKEEFLHLDDGSEIRLDYLISVAGHVLPENSKCST